MSLPDTKTLLVERQNHVLWVTLNRPKARNAMSLQMVSDLQGVLEATADDSSLRAIVLRGVDGHFCAGGDIKDMAGARAQVGSGGEAGHNPFFTLNRQFGHLISQANRQPQVIVAVLEGAVLGGGFGLACVSDVAIAAADAQFGLPETGLGVIPAQIAPFVVTRVGLTQARRLALLGARFDGKEAVRLGIAHYVCENAAEIDSTIAEVLDQIKRCAPQANRLTKDLILKVGSTEMETLLDQAAEQFAAAVQGEEGAEGTMAFVQKRLPAWAE